MNDKQNQTPPSSKLGLTAEEAAGASIAQSIALAAQNEVDAYRNQNTVNMVAMGVAYAKWLQNPMLSKQYSELVNSTRLSMGEQESDTIKAFAAGSEPKPRGPLFGYAAADEKPEPAPAASAHSPAAGAAVHSLAGKVFNYFLSPPAKPEQS
ncbi:hypothetical protein [Rheinheimera texasensis]|uniref:hypothetical protein n=1 Tax=Rheinheimera texasensis TaxID=306205 RepID=UPI0032B2C9A8